MIKQWILSRRKAIAALASGAILHALANGHGALANLGSRVVDVPGVVHLTVADLLTAGLTALIVYGVRNVPDLSRVFPGGKPAALSEAERVAALELTGGTAPAGTGRRPDAGPE